MEEISPKLTSDETPSSLTQADDIKPSQNKRNLPKYVLIFIPFFILIVIIGAYFLSTRSQHLATKIVPKEIKGNAENSIEVATHTYFKDGKPVQKITEENKKFKDGSLQTIVSTQGKQLSRQLFLKDKILSLRNKVLTQQIFKKSSSDIQYKTSGEYFLTLVKNTPNLPKTTSTLNGKKVIIYTVGEAEVRSLRVIPQAFAADESGVTKIYVDEEKNDLEKVEILDSSTNLVNQEIVYETDIIEEVEQSGKDSTPQENVTPDSLARDMEEDADTSNDIIVDAPAPLVPENDPITIFPLSIIPTEFGYNSAYVDVVSNIFGFYEIIEKVLSETNVFDNEKFVQENIKVRVNGIEIPYQNFNISIEATRFNGEDKGVVRFIVPIGLQPGYHTVEIFSVDTWYLAPSLMVTLPESGEDIIELQLYSERPPTTSVLPDNQGYTISLSGKNLFKPFKVVLSDSMGEEFLIEDENILLQDADELVLNLPPSFSPGIYSLTITKGSQTIYRPNYIAVGR